MCGVATDHNVFLLIMYLTDNFWTSGTSRHSIVLVDVKLFTAVNVNWVNICDWISSISKKVECQ